ncbi:unnamed protein product [Ixodes hexagonus]
MATTRLDICGFAGLCFFLLACSVTSSRTTGTFPEERRNEIWGRNDRNVGRKVNVTLFYESMCPYSKAFITGQLFPTYNRLRDYMEVVLVPFGNGHINKKTLRSGNTYISITCQHGANECKGNTIQACAIKKYTRTKEWLSLIACMSAFSDPYRQGKKCAESLKLEWPDVGRCSNGKEGQDLLYLMGRLTKAQRPRVNHVPYVVFDGVYDRDTEARAEKSLFDVVCEKLGEEKPHICYAE